MQKYPRGSRGSPAKGVASDTVARVQISSSAPKKDVLLGHPFLALRASRITRVFSRVHARSVHRASTGKNERILATTLCFLGNNLSSSAPPLYKRASFFGVEGGILSKNIAIYL